jgi:IMP dehydrogenase/GMP reductase
MNLTLRYQMQTPDMKPMPLRDAVVMFYEGKLSKIAEQLNREALADAGLEHIELQRIELEKTPKGGTVLVIVTAAIYRESNTKQ